MANDKAFKTPGQLISALLEEKGWTKRTLAIVLDMDETGVARLTADKRPLDASLALALEDVFGVPAEEFLELQKSYDLAKARLVARPNPGRAARAQLFGQLPVTDMIKRGWLDVGNIKDVPRVERALTKFFEVENPEEIVPPPHAARKTAAGEQVTPVQSAWIQRVRQIAKEMLIKRYSPQSVRGGVHHLSKMLSAAEEARKAPRILAECGIRFVIVESLPSAKIDGVCFWLDDSSPVIGMSLRHDRIDNFWFVLRHEIEHVLQLHGRHHAMMDVELEGERAGTGLNVADEERVANAAAANFCVPATQLQGFMARKAPYFSERDILGFSTTLRIHPGLVAGQLQHKTGRYDRFRNHLVKIRSIVAPSATVDGWGDVAPVGI